MSDSLSYDADSKLIILIRNVDSGRVEIKVVWMHPIMNLCMAVRTKQYALVQFSLNAPPARKA